MGRERNKEQDLVPYSLNVFDSGSSLNWKRWYLVFKRGREREGGRKDRGVVVERATSWRHRIVWHPSKARVIYPFRWMSNLASRLHRERCVRQASAGQPGQPEATSNGCHFRWRWETDWNLLASVIIFVFVCWDDKLDCFDYNNNIYLR